jgi:teichuronic acid biosynthesis glycosyltransferase TuaG
MKLQSENLVSIVIPVFNAAPYLSETIRSVLSQSHTNWELLLIDDASQDESAEIILQYKKADPRIKLLRMETNSGVAAARNKGIAEAQGRYLTFLDADDYWDKNKLARQLSFMQSKNSKFSYTAYMFTDSSGALFGKRVHVPEEINYSGALKNNIIWTSTVMIDITVVSKDHIYMPNLTYGEDAASWWKLLSIYGPAQGIDEVYAYYRRTTNSLSANKFKALVNKWSLYRSIAGLSALPCIYYWSFSLINATLKRV